jgi:dTDP-4-dehydrorhamnose 3,5-epimerase
MHRDARGALSEIFRADWDLAIRPVQWNVLHSAAGVLRGVHVHLRHTDYIVIVSGSVSVGLSDLRRRAGTERPAALIELSGDELAGLLIPPGVAHGFLFHEPCVMLHGVSHHWDAEDELGCHWADPALAIPWPAAAVTLSPRDAILPPASDLLNRVAAAGAVASAGI